MMTDLARQFFAVAHNQPAKRALWCDGETIGYGDLAARAARLAHALAARGVAPGDVIGVLGRNSIGFVTLMLAAADLGAVLAPLSPTLPPDTAAAILQTAGARHVFADDAALHALRASAAHAFPGLWCALEDATSSDATSLDALIAAAPADAAPLGRGAAEAPFILSATSGATGAPKAIILTQGAKLARARAATALYGVRASDNILAATPLYHSLAERLVLTALTSGATCLLMSRYSPALWLTCVERESASFTIAVSSQLSEIARRLRAEPEAVRIARCKSLRCVVSSSAPLNGDDKAMILATLPGEFHECYGASEIAIATSLNLTAQDAPLASVGNAAPGVELRVLDDSDAPLPIGEIGEIACRTPMAFAGYQGRPDLTSAAMCDGYFKTGDLGRLDSNGALYFVGRKKDIIITGGINVYPADVEVVILNAPGVRECAAFALADAQLGELVAVAIAPSAPGAVSARTLRRLCAERLADFQQPQRFFFVDALPRNSMGKIMRRDLPALAQVLAAGP